MALTIDEKKKILELRGRSYSYRKIADQTGNSETTVRKVVREAEKRTIALKAEGLQTDQIVSQSNYPLVFVSNVIDKRSAIQDEQEKAGAEASRLPSRVDFKADWEEFKKQQALEIAKEELHERAKDLIDDLDYGEKQLSNERIINITLRKRIDTLRKKVKDFVLKRIDEVDSEEGLGTIEGIIEEIDQEVSSLWDELSNTIQKTRELRQQEEKKRSHQLLDSTIDIPLFPNFVKKGVKERFLVRTDEEASIVGDAIFQIALLIMRDSEKGQIKQEQMWHAFLKIIKEGGWSYLRRMAAAYRQDNERMMISINVCPNCEGKLTRKRVEDKVIISCPACGKAWEILER